ncbi:hypothetical protein ACSMAE_001005 [Cronobacter sakazakii]|nr:hypothetical protein [Cronobacter sakazakii]MDK1304911.1 hypothetical protein [Cronobacter sakazakii]
MRYITIQKSNEKVKIQKWRDLTPAGIRRGKRQRGIGQKFLV